jgi:hypothetical protein
MILSCSREHKANLVLDSGIAGSGSGANPRKGENVIGSSESFPRVFVCAGECVCVCVVVAMLFVWSTSAVPTNVVYQVPAVPFGISRSRLCKKNQSQIVHFSFHP